MTPKPVPGSNRNFKFKGARLIISVVCAFLIVFLDYLISNLTFPILDESESLTLLGYFQRNKTQDEPEDLFCVNVALDKQLAPVKESVNGDTIGYIPITDRAALLRILELAETSNPKYILLDIRFEEGLHTVHDSALFSKIRSVPRLVLATHREKDYHIGDTALLDKAAMADYRRNFLAGFSRYEYIQDGKESVALRMYNDIDGGNIEKKGLFYLSDGDICYNMQFIPLPAALDSRYGQDVSLRYPYLMAEIFGLKFDEEYRNTDEEIRQKMEGKFVIIGDFDNDIHEAYNGYVPGPMLHYYAYKMLSEGRHRVNIIYLLVQLLVYTIISYILLDDNDALKAFTRRLGIKSPAAVFILSFFGWGTVLLVLKIVLFYTLDISFIALVPTIVFSVIALPGAYRRLREEQRKAQNEEEIAK